MKGYIIRKILKICEEKGFITLGIYDEKSCKQYLILDNKTLHFLSDVIKYMYHPERKFKIERYLTRKGLISIEKGFHENELFKICIKRVYKRLKNRRVYTVVKPSDKVCVSFLVEYLSRKFNVKVSYYKSRNEIVIDGDVDLLCNKF